jgi:RNA polymerase sigma-70 factor (ECF subfamily)
LLAVRPWMPGPGERMADQDPIGARTDEELARDARAGSRRSFEELALRYKRRLFVYFRSRAGSDQDAEDMVQETFLKLFRNIGSYDSAFRFSTWLYTSASRLAIDSFRKSAAARDGLAAARSGELAGLTEGGSREPGVSPLWDTARTLGPNRFRALWLRYGEDMSIEEIAAVLGRTKLAVRILLHRARTNLMELLGPDLSCATRPRPRTARETAGE